MISVFIQWNLSLYSIQRRKPLTTYTKIFGTNSNEMDLKDKVAIVTGASAGIGAATVRVLLKAGMKVVGFARRKERIANLVGDHGGKLFALSVDVTKPQEVLDGFAWVTQHVGPVHVLINNAGVAPPTSVITGNLETWRKIMDTNFTAVAIGCKEAIRIMEQHHIDGYIINVNSIFGYYDLENPMFTVYRSSKCALTAMTENIRIELARMGSKIKITGLAPGMVKTEILETNGLEKRASESFYAKFPHLLAEDVASTIVYLLSTPPHVHVSELIIRPLGEDLKQFSTESAYEQ